MATLQPERPNVIWILDDQLRAQSLSYTGDPNVVTPNIDRLAAEGMSFNAAVAGCPLCCPYRGSNGQFRKTSPWEESIRVPFIMGGGLPRYGHALGQAPVPINHVDIAPTTLGLCGIEAPNGWLAQTIRAIACAGARW